MNEKTYIEVIYILPKTDTHGLKEAVLVLWYRTEQRVRAALPRVA